MSDERSRTVSLGCCAIFADVTRLPAFVASLACCVQWTAVGSSTVSRNMTLDDVSIKKPGNP